MRAYSELYVSEIQERLGVMFDVGLCEFGWGLSEFYKAFLDSKYARALSMGSPVFVIGRSGVEIAEDITGMTLPDADYLLDMPKTEYWTGWALAFFQWASGRTFEDIRRRVPIEDIYAMYVPYHEMDITQFCDAMDERCFAAGITCNLKQKRIDAELSQSQLADLSGVPVRTLQQYEQRQKDINHARADYVLALAKTLQCEPAALLEPKASESYAYAFVALP